MKKALQVKTKYFCCFLLLFCLIVLKNANSAGSYLIRDAEVESYVKDIIHEILVVAGINPKSVGVYVIKNDDINAFVYNGSNIFIHTGLLQASSSYQVVQAVLAHEIGHIAGSHLISFSQNVNKALIEAMFYSVTGALLVFAGGGGAESLIAGLGIATNVAEKRILSYSRKQEAEADFLATKYLQSLKSSGIGAVSIFQKFTLMQDKVIDTSKANIYNTTHPFPQDRLKYIISRFQNVPYKPYFDDNLQTRHLYITAKLAGYFDNMSDIFSKDFLYSPNSKEYYLGFKSFKSSNFEEAKKHFSHLIEQYPKNAFFSEAMGELSYKVGDFKSSLSYYKKSDVLMPNNFILLFQIAEVYFALDDYQMAIKFMNRALLLEPYNPQGSFKLATYYSKMGRDITAKIYFLETETLRQNWKKAKELLRLIKIEMRSSNEELSSADLKKLQDIVATLKTK